MYTFKNSNSFYYIKYKQYNIFCTQFALNWSFTLHIKHVPYFLNLLTINYIKLFFWRFLFFWMWTIFKVFIDSVVSGFCFGLFAGEGNGTPLQYSCLENPMDGGAC